MKAKGKGKFVIVVGPSGTGKDTMVNMLREKYPGILVSISTTTRAMRPGEVDGVDYYFLSKEDFKNKINNGDFFEWVEYSGNYYGTLKKPIFDAIDEGKIIMNDIDVRGLMTFKKALPSDNFVSIFFMPPSIDVLIERIKSRAEVDSGELKKRMKTIEFEMEFADEATVKFTPIDGDIEGSFEKFEKIAQEFIFEK